MPMSVPPAMLAPDEPPIQCRPGQACASTSHTDTRLQEGHFESTVAAVADRIAQTAAAMTLEPEVEKIFRPDSCGYRPGKSALDAAGACRERCWRTDWGAPG